MRPQPRPGPGAGVSSLQSEARKTRPREAAERVQILCPAADLLLWFVFLLAWFVCCLFLYLFVYVAFMYVCFNVLIIIFVYYGPCLFLYV